MAGPLVHWPNRKSKLGLQKSSKVPRAHRAPWATEPPIMKSSKLQLLIKSRDVIAEVDTPEFRESLAIEVDRHLPAYAGVIAHMFTLLDASRQACKDARGSLDEAEKSFAESDRRLAEAREMTAKCKEIANQNLDLRAENESLVADLRKLRAEIDPDEIALKIMYAVDEATKAKNDELRASRAEVAELKSRVEELERSKRKLREALSRLSEKT